MWRGSGGVVGKVKEEEVATTLLVEMVVDAKTRVMFLVVQTTHDLADDVKEKLGALINLWIRVVLLVGEVALLIGVRLDPTTATAEKMESGT